MRAWAGFRDVEWSVALAIGCNPELPPESYRSLRFQRFVHEMVDGGSGFACVPEWIPGLPREGVAALKTAPSPIELSREQSSQ